MTRLSIQQAESSTHFDCARDLFLEYEAAIGPSPCFRTFESELAELRTRYAHPRGRVLLASVGDDLAGCCALAVLEAGVAEMRRLWVRPHFRGSAVGRALAERVIRSARASNLLQLRLMTLPSMSEALALYPKLGFTVSEGESADSAAEVIPFQLPLVPSESRLFHVLTVEDLDVFARLHCAYEEEMQCRFPGASLAAERASLPEPYAPPRGRLLLIDVRGTPVGIVALRPLDDTACEMRRLYVQPGHRRKGIGRKTSMDLCLIARELGYRTMRLLTIPSIQEAHTLYRSIGFEEVPPYRETSAAKPLFMEFDLEQL